MILVSEHISPISVIIFMMNYVIPTPIAMIDGFGKRLQHLK